MKTNFGKPLTRDEMKEIQGGKIQGCAQYMQVGIAYSGGCCTGLYACYTIPQNHDLYCVPSNECNNN